MSIILYPIANLTISGGLSPFYKDQDTVTHHTEYEYNPEDYYMDIE